MWICCLKYHLILCPHPSWLNADLTETNFSWHWTSESSSDASHSKDSKAYLFYVNKSSVNKILSSQCLYLAPAFINNIFSFLTVSVVSRNETACAVKKKKQDAIKMCSITENECCLCVLMGRGGCKHGEGCMQQSLFGGCKFVFANDCTYCFSF